MQEGPLLPSELAALSGILVNPRFLESSCKSERIKSNAEAFVGILPIELIMNIFFRLAFKDLVSLKHASKLLSNLISSPYIANSYLQQSICSGSNRPFLFFRDIAACYSIQMDRLEKLDLDNKAHHRLARGIGVVGSCNGLVCVRSGRNREIFYNPSTRERHELPPSPVGVPNSTTQGLDHIYHHIKYGFGYDSACGDYKVLKIFAFYSDSDHVHVAHSVMTYSLNNNSWRNVETFPRYINELESDNGELCNETLHWVYKARSGSFVEKGIIGFELHSETFHQVPLPDHVHLSDISLGTLDGYLCVCFHVNELAVNSLYVWVMKSYGAKDFWSFLFGIADNRRSSITHFRPIAYSESGDEVLVDFSSTHFLWFDLRSKKIKCYVPCHHSGAVFCHQSIASPKSASLNVNHNS